MVICTGKVQHLLYVGTRYLRFDAGQREAKENSVVEVRKVGYVSALSALVHVLILSVHTHRERLEPVRTSWTGVGSAVNWESNSED